MKRFFIILLAVLLIAAMVPWTSIVRAAGLVLYTPYSGISVTPGETIDYKVDVINETNAIQHVTFAVEGLQKGWTYEITSGGWNLQKLSVKPGETQSFELNLQVPLEVQKGTYDFRVLARADSGLETRLPLQVNVTEKGTYKTELIVEQPNLEGHADSDFRFEAQLKNRTAVEQHYALTHEAPRGWDVDFRVDGKSVTSVTLESNSSKDLNVVVTPPQEVQEGTYQIPIKASANSTSAEAVLEVVITGKYALQLSTPSGRLSDEIHAGGKKVIELEVKNTGTALLRDIELDAKTPIDWMVEFEPQKIQKLEPGKSVKVKATITAADKAIAGDYVVNMEARTPEVSAEAAFRISVKTSLLWGWIGVLIILAVIGGIYYLVRTYGRR